MIVDKLEDWVRAGMPTTAEREARARKLVTQGAQRALENWLPGTKREPRPPVTLSSHFACSRELYYDLMHPKEPDFSPRALDAFSMGINIEHQFIAKCILAGITVLYPDEDGNQLRAGMYMDGDAIRGSADMLVEIDGKKYVVEIKSSSSYGWDAMKKSGVIDNMFGHADQLSHYMRMMKCDTGIYISLKKDTGHALEIHLKSDEERFLRNEATYRAAKMAVAAGQPPERPDFSVTKIVRAPGGTVERLDSVKCSYCGRRARCMPDFDQAVVQGKVVYQRPVKE